MSAVYSIFFSKLISNKVNYCSAFPIRKDMYCFFNENVKMTKEKIINLRCDTINQAACKSWFEARECRISASSNVHSIKSRHKKTVEKLLSEMLNPSKVETSATQYGQKHKKDALSKYEKIYNVEVVKVGVIVSEQQPWLKVPAQTELLKLTII